MLQLDQCAADLTVNTLTHAEPMPYGKPAVPIRWLTEVSTGAPVCQVFTTSYIDPSAILLDLMRLCSRSKFKKLSIWSQYAFIQKMGTLAPRPILKFSSRNMIFFSSSLARHGVMRMMQPPLRVFPACQDGRPDHAAQLVVLNNTPAGLDCYYPID
ncbi:hypothetical protein LX36DRAFT_351139 [Colletotrichum falcatum]|nr:hypothetical protein LX36DRAFT_351139 [Colletotrichum falcatum]